MIEISFSAKDKFSWQISTMTKIWIYVIKHLHKLTQLSSGFSVRNYGFVWEATFEKEFLNISKNLEMY